MRSTQVKLVVDGMINAIWAIKCRIGDRYSEEVEKHL